MLFHCRQTGISIEFSWNKLNVWVKWQKEVKYKDYYENVLQLGAITQGN